MTKTNKYNYLAKNTILFTISSFGSKILVFLLVPLYTSILSTTDYGIADTITTTASLLIYIFTLNIQDAVLRFAIEHGKNPKQYLAYGIRMLNIGSVALVVILILIKLFNVINWDGYFYLFLFLQYYFVAIYHIYSNYLRAIDKVKEVAISGIITTLVTIFCNIIFLLFFKVGLIGYLISMVVGSLASSVYCNIIISYSPIKLISLSVDKTIRKSMLMYSVPLIFNGIAWWMNNSIDKYFVIGILGQAQNGIYAVSYKIPTIMTVLHNIFFQAWNLSAIKEFDPKDKDGFFAETYTLYNACLILACSGLILFNIPIARVLFAKDFFVAWKYSSVLLLSIVFSALAGFVGSVFTAVKDSRIFAVSTVISALMNCVLNFVLIPIWGVMGAAIATYISFGMIWLNRLVCSYKYIKWKINWVRDVVAYILLVIQCCVEHSENHLYIIQILIIVILLLLYKREFNKIIRTMLNKFSSLKKKFTKTGRE